jgi:hypothetical protein
VSVVPVVSVIAPSYSVTRERAIELIGRAKPETLRRVSFAGPRRTPASAALEGHSMSVAAISTA